MRSRAALDAGAYLRRRWCAGVPHPTNLDALRFEQPHSALLIGREGMDVEIRIAPVRRHNRRGGRYDQKPAAFSDPVHMPMPVHHDDMIGDALQLSDEPSAVDEGGSDALRQSLRGLRVFHHVMVKRHDPARLWILANDGVERAR